MDLLSVLSPAGVRRPAAFRGGGRAAGAGGRRLPGLEAEAADRVLARLAGVSLVTFSVDGTAVTAHRLVMRVIRENLAAAGKLTAACRPLPVYSTTRPGRCASGGIRTGRRPGTWSSRSPR